MDGGQIGEAMAEIRRLKERVQALETAASGQVTLPSVLEVALRLIEADPHSFGTRGCQTCTALTALAGRSFGCVKRSEGR